jgi:hypothetical protein
MSTANSTHKIVSFLDLLQDTTERFAGIELIATDDSKQARRAYDLIQVIRACVNDLLTENDRLRVLHSAAGISAKGEYNCDHCGVDAPDGSAFFVPVALGAKEFEDRVCFDCFQVCHPNDKSVRKS